MNFQKLFHLLAQLLFCSSQTCFANLMMFADVFEICQPLSSRNLTLIGNYTTIHTCLLQGLWQGSTIIKFEEGISLYIPDRYV